METELGLLTRVRDLQYLIDFADLIYVECNVTKEEGDEAGDFSDQRETEIATTNMGTMIAQLHFTCEYLLKDIFEAVRAMFPDQASQEAYLVKLAEGEDLQLIQTVISNRNMHLANFAYCQQMLNHYLNCFNYGYR